MKDKEIQNDVQNVDNEDVHVCNMELEIQELFCVGRAFGNDSKVQVALSAPNI